MMLKRLWLVFRYVRLKLLVEHLRKGNRKLRHRVVQLEEEAGVSDYRRVQ